MLSRGPSDSFSLAGSETQRRAPQKPFNYLILIDYLFSCSAMRGAWIGILLSTHRIVNAIERPGSSALKGHRAVGVNGHSSRSGLPP